MFNCKLTVLLLTIFVVGCESGEEHEKSDSSLVVESNEPATIDYQAQNNSQNVPIPIKTSVISNEWELVWQDEFDEDTIDTTKWQFEVNCYGGGNDEQQCYTDRQNNAYVEKGALNIVALKELYSGPRAQDDDPAYNVTDIRTLPYTSARVRTKHQADWTYGRFVVKAKLPFGQGTWPAIWMLPTEWAYGGWAGSGEIDIMEAVNLKSLSDDIAVLPGQTESRVHGTLHYGRAWPDNVYSGIAFNFPDGINPADSFHEYAIEWQEGEIRWYVDNIHYATQRSSGWYSQYMNEQSQLITGENSAPFDQPFHLILNLAIGGNWAANVNEKGIDDSIFPQKLLVDYVRVYQCQVSPSNGAGCETISEGAKLVEGHQAPAL